MGLIDNRAQFIQRKGGYVIEHAVRTDKVTAVREDLDPVGAKADLLAHGFARVIWAVDALHAVRHLNFGRISQQRISAGDVHGARIHIHPWPSTISTADGVL